MTSPLGEIKGKARVFPSLNMYSTSLEKLYFEIDAPRAFTI